jgi:ABC-type Fe3+ transport system substrate-binding protein
MLSLSKHEKPFFSSLLDPVRTALILPEVLDESKWWSGRHHYVDPENDYIFVFIGSVSRGSVFYNKNLVNPNEFRSYWDLLNPKWRGKILALDPRAPGPQRAGVRELYHIPELGPKFLRRLFGEMDVTLSRDERQAADWLAVGRFPICLFCADAANAKNQGLPVDEFETAAWKETPTVSPGGTGSIILLNRAPHPNAAKLFINWLLSREGQVLYQKFVNTSDTTAESMRIDIPKDPIPPTQRCKDGIPYITMHSPERADQMPIDKFLNELLKR